MPDQDDDIESGIEEAGGPRLGHIAFARIEPLTLNAAMKPAEALEAALVTGTRITRHNRTWYMGQYRREGASLVGRIGFEAESIGELWDIERQDFSEEQVRSGLTSPFAIDPNILRVAFQLRPGVIRVKSFTGALQALLNCAAPQDRWRVEQESETVSFDDWVRTVDRVVNLRIRLERPNPHYNGREHVKHLVDGANARMAEVAWKADTDSLDGLDISEPFIREAIGHANKYGSYSARGERDDAPMQWGSDQEAAAEQREVEADPITREVPATALREQLGDITQPETGS